MKTLCLKALLAAVGLTSVAAALANPYVSAGATGVDADAPMQLLKVGDRIGTPPPDPVGTAVPEAEGQTLRDQVLANMKQRFDAAADPSTHLLSLADAKRSGWGYIADHFSAIDRSGSGYVSFDDLKRYLKAKKGAAFANS
ncbi:EF-hand domain-containing protein [Paraburkholderia megapolitana]|uniref:EF-hand domain-containing protein n=2 Tax=Paraburkholderia megapolitana TaxID=420953 RepID=A0A1I3MN57_9BURK|nr:EF-hand domain-containing protein [Paraburkholderia megapolitana]SFI98361.1 hypothetical protein SAMN05192543_10539 [Paraburkholderia megapolitana]